MMPDPALNRTCNSIRRSHLISPGPVAARCRTTGGFKFKDTQALFDGKFVRRWASVERHALRKLAQLDWSTVLGDLKVPPGKGLEALKDDRKGLGTQR